MHHLLKKFLRLRSFNSLISFSACALRGDVELFLGSLFRSCGLTSTGDELLSVRSHVACVSKHSQNKDKPCICPRQGSGASIGCFASEGSKKNDAGQTLYAWTPPLEVLNTIISIAAKPLADVRNECTSLCPVHLSPEPGGNRSNKFRARRAQHSTRTYVLVRQSLQ